MADDNSSIIAEFEEFLNEKRRREKEESDSEDYEVEIWDEKGRGARVRRSHAKPFLQSLGIDLDPEPKADPEKNSGENPPKSSRQSSGPRKADSVTRKYFVRQPKG